jgi:hypothetical protein
MVAGSPAFRKKAHRRPDEKVQSSQAGHQLGSAAVAYGAGLSRTAYASYLPAFFISGALCLLAALLVLSIAKPKPRGLQPQPA